MKTKLSDLLRKLLYASDITQTKLAKKVGVNQAYMSDILNDKKTPLSPKIIVGISKVFNVDENEILEAALYSRTEELRRKYDQLRGLL